MKSFLQFDEDLELEEQLYEVLSKDAKAGDWIDDFVKSDNPKFAGKSKKERVKMALGAYYGAQKEEKEMKGDDPCWKDYEMVGHKMKNGKKVPNCVPKEEVELDEDSDFIQQHLADKDINSSVQGKTVKVHSSNVSAAKKHLAKAGYKDHKVVSGLNEEQIDELNKSTLANYAKKSHDQLMKHTSTVNFKTGRGDSDAFAYERDKDNMRKTANRTKGLHQAINKMAKEEVELDESSVTTGEYFKKHFDKAMAAKEAGDSEKFKQHYQAAKTARYGMSSAALTKHKDALDKFKALKEEALDEISKETLTSYAHKSFAAGNELHKQIEKETDPAKKAELKAKLSKRNTGVIKAAQKVKEENTMLTYAEFMEKLQEGKLDDLRDRQAAEREKRLSNYDYSKEKEAPKSNVTKHYAKHSSEHDDEEDNEKKPEAQPEVKRGRGRPKGWSGTYKRRNS